MDISKSLDKRNGKNYNEDFRKYINKKRIEKNISLKKINELFGLSTDGGGVASYIFSERQQNGLPTKEQYLILKNKLELDDRFDDLIFIEEAEREVIGTKKSGGASAWINGMNNKENEEQKYTGFSEWEITVPSTDLAKQWQGWGTALKPAFEPIIVARKPFKGSLVDNVIKWGVGGLNIDECRINFSNNEPDKRVGKIDIQKGASKNPFATGISDYNNTTYKSNGRFPANLILTYEQMTFDEVCGGFPNTKGNENIGHNKNDDSGSASRYFYCAKASKKDRDEGLEEFETKKVNDGRKKDIDNAFQRGTTLRHNTHPTVKPTELMQYLIRLVTPDNGIILDPFMGSGSTGKACMYENREHNKNYRFIGIEKEKEYYEIAKERIKNADRLE